VKKGQDAGRFTTRKTARAFARFLFGNITALRVAAQSGTDKKVLQDIVDVTLSAVPAVAMQFLCQANLMILNNWRKFMETILS